MKPSDYFWVLFCEADTKKYTDFFPSAKKEYSLNRRKSGFFVFLFFCLLRRGDEIVPNFALCFCCDAFLSFDEAASVVAPL